MFIFSPAEETDEGLAAFAGEFDGEAAGGGDGSHNRHPGGEGFLQHLEGGAAAEQQDMAAQGQAIFQQRPADDFVEGVVAAKRLREARRRLPARSKRAQAWRPPVRLKVSWAAASRAGSCVAGRRALPGSGWLVMDGNCRRARRQLKPCCVKRRSLEEVKKVAQR